MKHTPVGFLAAVAALALCGPSSAAQPSAPSAASSRPPADAAIETPAETAKSPAPQAINRPLPSAPGTFSGEYHDASARELLMDIAHSARMSVVLPSDLEGNVTARFDSMPVMQAIAYVVQQVDADYRVMDGTVTVTKRAIVVRPRAAETAPAMSEREVERVAAQIDAQDASRARRGAEPVRVETYISVQASPSYPGFAAAPALPVYPVYPGAVPYGGVYQVRFDPYAVREIGYPIPGPWGFGYGPW